MATKMTGLKVHETSGVDHPAHLHEGFAVMKAADPTRAKAAWSALGKDRNMNAQRPGSVRPAPGLEKAAADAIQKAIDSKLQPILDEAAKVWQDLRAFAEQADGDTPSSTDAPATADPAAPAPAAATPAPVAASADGLDTEVLKALPEAVRTMLEKSASAVAKATKDAEEARAEVAKERDARLDQEAIAVAKSTYGNLALGDDTVKGLRALSVASPEVFKSVEALLVATNAQLDGAPLLKELGQPSGGATETGLQKVEKAARELVESGEFESMSLAKAHVYETRADLADTVRKEA